MAGSFSGMRLMLPRMMPSPYSSRTGPIFPKKLTLRHSQSTPAGARQKISTIVIVAKMSIVCFFGSANLKKNINMTKCQSFCAGIFFDFNRNIKITKNMIRPLADRVVIEPKAAETQTASGLFIPDTAKEKPQQGTVVAAGPGKKDEPMEVKVGDVVIYGKYAGTDVSVDGKDYLIMKQSDILAIL